MSRIRLVIVGLLLTLGCARETPPEPRIMRPAPGDTVAPELFLVQPWNAGGKAQVTIRLLVSGPDQNETTFLQFDEVPEEISPQAEVTFWQGNEVLIRLADMPLKRDC